MVCFSINYPIKLERKIGEAKEQANRDQFKKDGLPIEFGVPEIKGVKSNQNIKNTAIKGPFPEPFFPANLHAKGVMVHYQGHKITWDNGN